MIVLSSCSINLSANNYLHSSTGERDSVLIAYDDLRIVNSKLVELDYEKQLNAKLRQMIHNDSILLKRVNVDLGLVDKKYHKVKRQRNVFGSIAIVGVITSLIFIFK